MMYTKFMRLLAMVCTIAALATCMALGAVSTASAAPATGNTAAVQAAVQAPAQPCWRWHNGHWDRYWGWQWWAGRWGWINHYHQGFWGCHR